MLLYYFVRFLYLCPFCRCCFVGAITLQYDCDHMTDILLTDLTVSISCVSLLFLASISLFSCMCYTILWQSLLIWTLSEHCKWQWYQQNLIWMFLWAFCVCIHFVGAIVRRFAALNIVDYNNKRITSSCIVFLCY